MLYRTKCDIVMKEAEVVDTTGLETDNRAKWLDYKYIISRRVLFEEVQHTGDCSITREVC